MVAGQRSATPVLNHGTTSPMPASTEPPLQEYVTFISAMPVLTLEVSLTDTAPDAVIGDGHHGSQWGYRSGRMHLVWPLTRHWSFKEGKGMWMWRPPIGVGMTNPEEFVATCRIEGLLAVL